MMFHVKFLPSLLYICLLFLLINNVAQGATAVPSNQPKPLQRVFPHLAWLKDAAVDKVFDVAKTLQRAKNSRSGQPPSSSQLPATVLAKYGRDVILRFKLSTVAEEIALAEAADKLFLDIWDFSHHWMDLRLREDDVPSLLGILPESLQKAYSNLMPDLAKTIYDSYPPVDLEPESPSIRTERVFTPALRTADGVENAFFRDYQPFSVIFPWMRLMASMFKTHVRMISLGITYEGRDIPALRVGVSPGLPHEPQEPRKTIVISGGLHAREWISVSTVTYIAWSLITSYGKIPDITKLLHEFDFVLIPTMNPDGYVYTWETDRLWKKNRQQTSLRFCRGLDLDHGFGFEWDSTMYQSSPCSESYPGSQPFQAVESHRLAAWATNETENNGIKFVGFLDLHSYSQQVLYPYAYSCTHEPPSLENLEELGLGLAREIRRSSGKAYQVHSACESTIPSKTADVKTLRMEAGGGSAIDWFYHELRVRYSYQIKLRDTGIYGFLLPKEHIIPTGKEIFEAVKYFGNYLLSNKGVESITNEPEPSNVLVGEKTEVDQVGKDPLELKWDLKRRGRR